MFRAIMNFINNIRYLFKYSLKRMNCEIEDVGYAINHIKFEIEEDLKILPKINFMPNEEALSLLINSEISLCRLGDGEMDLMQNIGIEFQRADNLLAQRLNEVVSTANDRILVGILPIFTSFIGADIYAKNRTRSFMGKNKESFLAILNKNRTYCNAGMTCAYIYNAGEEYAKELFNSFRKIWDKKNIVIICGDRVLKNIEHNIYDNAQKVEYIYAPSKNAFDKYDEILNNAKSYDKDTLFILMVGPTATILAYDLAKDGYRALDLGHVAKDYDAFCKKLPRTTKNIKKFFAAD